MPETKVLNVGGGSFNKKCEEVIDDDEKELYDRQIRLWGLDAQNRLRNSSVLLAGLSGCGAEVAKNLMLAGVSSLTLLDHSEVTKDDEYCQFMIPLESVGKNRAECSKERCQSLNPRVKLIVDKSDVSEKADDFFLQFDLVILTNQKYSVIERVDNICRKANIKFEAGGVYGWIGYGFFDFNNHHFLIKSQKVQHAVLDMDEETIENIQNGGPSSSKRMRKDDDTSFSSLPNGSQKLIADIDLSEDDDVRVKKQFQFPNWSDSMNVDWDQKKLIRKVRRFLPPTYFPIRAMLTVEDKNENFDEELLFNEWKNELERCNRKDDENSLQKDTFKYFLGPQLSSACAIVGGVVAQEAIKALSGIEEPLQNFFVYSALNTAGVVCRLPPLL